MAKSHSTVRRVLYAVVALAVVVALAPTAFAVKPDKVREFNECMKTCNALKDTCDATCVPDCTAAFPGNQAAIDACVLECSTACARVMQNCKGGCKFEKSGKTPNLPS